MNWTMNMLHMRFREKNENDHCKFYYTGIKGSAKKFVEEIFVSDDLPRLMKGLSENNYILSRNVPLIDF